MEKYLRLGIIAIALCIIASACGFTEKYSDVSFEITSTTDKTVAITKGETPYSGNISIPKNVTIDGEKYSVTAIAEEAFRDCDSLLSVKIPNSVTEIGRGAFDGCVNLTSVEIPNSVTEIGEEVFSGCHMKSIKIPNSVTKIGREAFAACTELTSVEIPNSVTEIGSGAFSNCYSLTSVVIPNSITEISSYTFSKCSLNSVKIPESVTKIEFGAFHDCNALKKIYVEATTPPACHYWPFGALSANHCTLYVPEEALARYDTTEPWSSFKNIEPYNF